MHKLVPNRLRFQGAIPASSYSKLEPIFRTPTVLYLGAKISILEVHCLSYPAEPVPDMLAPTSTHLHRHRQVTDQLQQNQSVHVLELFQKIVDSFQEAVLRYQSVHLVGVLESTVMILESSHQVCAAAVHAARTAMILENLLLACAAAVHAARPLMYFQAAVLITSGSPLGLD